MKGIVMAGGTGSRLLPITKSINKHLLPVFDKPMVFYPISVLMLAGIRDILLISKSEDLPLFQQLLSDGSSWGIQISYETQENPQGIAQAFLIGESFINGEDVVLILGDNVFYGNGLIEKLNQGVSNLKLGLSSIYAYRVDDSQRFGVVEFDENNNAISIEEKPDVPKSNYAVTGLYYYTKDVIEFAKRLKPSKRGELEITDLNNLYLKNESLKCITLGRGFAWLDTGTNQSLLDAASFISTIENRQGYKISVPEEIAYRKGWITSDQLILLAQNYGQSSYGKYLLRLVDEYGRR